MTEDKDGVPFDRPFFERSNSLAMQFPLEIVNWLNAEKTDKARIVPKEGKYGKYVEIFIPSKNALGEASHDDSGSE